MTRIDNDANVIAISGAMSSFKALDIVDVFLKTPFSNGERHVRRIQKITDYERRHHRDA